MIRSKLLLATVFAVSCAASAEARTIEIGIGHQSMCTDTYSAGLVIKELGLLEKRLPHDGQYKDVTYNITWKDYSSGGPITNEMLADKLDIGIMGDYPLIVNGAKFQATSSLRSLYVAGTGYNLRGSGNGIVVPVSSNIYSLDDLKGKSISTPIGSASWGMLLKAMQDAHIASSAYDLKNQAPAVGAANIAADKIDAHADFCPWSEIMEYRGTGRKIYDGSETGVPYLHGAVVRQDFAEKYPEIVVAFIESIYDAGQWIKADPMRAVENMEKWSGVEKEVLYLYFSKGGLFDSRSNHQAEMDRSPEIRRQRSTEGAGDSAARLQYLDHRPLRQSRLREAWRRLRSPTSPDRRPQGRQSKHADGNLARPRRHEGLRDDERLSQGRRRVQRHGREAQRDLCLRQEQRSQDVRQFGVLREGA